VHTFLVLNCVVSSIMAEEVNSRFVATWNNLNGSFDSTARLSELRQLVAKVSRSLPLYFGGH